MKKNYKSPVCEQFLVEDELLQAVSSHDSAIVTPGAGDLEGGGTYPPDVPIDDGPINGSDDFSKGGLFFEH